MTEIVTLCKVSGTDTKTPDEVLRPFRMQESSTLASHLSAIEAIQMRMVDIPWPAGGNVKRVDVGPEVCLSTVPCGR